MVRAATKGSGQGQHQKGGLLVTTLLHPLSFVTAEPKSGYLRANRCGPLVQCYSTLWKLSKKVSNFYFGGVFCYHNFCTRNKKKSTSKNRLAE